MIARKKRWFEIALLAAALALAAFVPTALADGSIVHVSGALEEDTTWDAGTVYVVDSDLTVSAGVTLTVPSGTVVKFDQYADIIVEGRLALGEEPTFHYVCLPLVLGSGSSTAASQASSGQTLASLRTAQPVILTSLADDSAGGDTNNDGNSSSPATGDWGGVFMEEGSLDSSYLAGFEIRYSGVPRNYYTCGAIVLDNASPHLKDGTFVENQIDGIEIPRTDLLSDVWDAEGMIYHLTDHVTIARGNKLVIPAGTIVKVAEHKRLVVDGALSASGTTAHPIVFTSWRDDTAGGATVADSDGAPATSDWGGIEFTQDSASSYSLADHVELRYTGRGMLPDTAPIQLWNCSPDMGTITFVEGYVHGATLEAERDTLTTLTLSSRTVPYIISDDLVVPQFETLTLEQGVVCKFRRTQSLIVEGALVARGTSWDPVTLTGFYDDTALGDTDTGGATPAPEAGDWGCVAFEPISDDSLCQMDWVTIRHGGADSLDFTTTMGPLRIDNAAPSLTNIRLENNNLNALSIAPGDWASASWDNVDLVHFVGDDITVQAGHTLQVAPGVVIKVFNPVAPSHQPQITVNGALQVGALSAAAATITSGRDDDAGPASVENWDSNNDGSASAPAINDWKGIVMASGADGSNSYMRNTVIKYGGLRWETFVDPHGALRLQGVSMPIEWCQFLGNYRGVEAFDGAAPTISATVFEGNDDYAVYNDAPGSATVSAVNNWWGHATGPSSDGQDCNTATGYGERVSCGVSFTPWWSAAP